MTISPPTRLAVLFSVAVAAMHGDNTLRFCIRSEPRTFHPLLVDDDASETVRYLTGGVLIRLNRKTQQLEPALASRWTVSKHSRQIDFVLRHGVRFSDGTPFGPADVVYTMQQLMNPELHSPAADSFRTSPGPVDARVTGPDTVTILFPGTITGLPLLFDQVPVMSSASPLKEGAVLGPYMVAEHKPGVSVTLTRNPYFWEHDSQARPLPRIQQIRLDIQKDRDGEALKLERGEIDFVQGIDAELFDRLRAAGNENLSFADLGPSLDSELMWFNQAKAARLPAQKRAWFSDPHFRRAVSLAIDRAQICRIVYRGHAVPARGPVSPSNKLWYNSELTTASRSLDEARKELSAAGFRIAGEQLKDRSGYSVEFSLISNSGNHAHERTLAIIQQNLQAIGIRVNVLTLDFASLIERITRSFDYEACLMSLTNVGLDPNEQMNVWLSSAGNHQWNPNQKQPATDWEARVDELMKRQASSDDPSARKKLFDEVQRIAREQQPFIYLVHPDVLTVCSKRVGHLQPALLRPQLYWNVEEQVMQ